MLFFVVDVVVIWEKLEEEKKETRKTFSSLFSVMVFETEPNSDVCGGELDRERKMEGTNERNKKKTKTTALSDV